ncbi:MAG: ketosteroid isomerase-like protein [Rhodothermales bacterium]|jgi:ketosteroid isomerase-like protein
MKTITSLLLIVALAACADPSGEASHADDMDHDAAMHVGDDMSETAVGDAVEAFRASIVANDSTAAASLLAENVRIVEGGNVETRDGYLSHHFHSDGAFLSAMTREPLTADVQMSGATAWSVSTSRLFGSYRDREIDMTSAELMVLEHGEGGWKVKAVHWSSGSN